MSARNDLNSLSFGKRVRKLEEKSATHSRQLNEAAAEQTKAAAADVRAKSVQRRAELETAIDSHNQMPPAQPPGWMLDQAAAVRLQNFQSLNAQPQTPVPPAMTAPWELEQMQATHNRRIGESLGQQQRAEQQWRLQHDATVSQLRHQRAMAPKPQSRRKGRYENCIQF